MNYSLDIEIIDGRAWPRVNPENKILQAAIWELAGSSSAAENFIKALEDKQDHLDFDGETIALTIKDQTVRIEQILDRGFEALDISRSELANLSKQWIEKGIKLQT